MPHTHLKPVAEDTAPVALKRIMVALDASDHANRALDEAVRLAGTAEGTITGIHAYAAKLHDRRFRQMEGGLPERYRKEEEMERQRDVHDDLITRGLDIISDSYHDSAGAVCEAAGRPYERLSPEGKNYRRILEALEDERPDLFVLGSLGLGAVPGSVVGTVCERVARRSPVDTLIIKNPELAIGGGPIVVGVDGSEFSFGALKSALDIGRRLGVPVHAVAAYDPYYHYVAFNKIAGVLSEEAGKVFRFKEQEQLHEELIDDGLAKIYQAHLGIAASVASDEGAELVTELLDGKPFKAIQDYVVRVGASLLMLGKTGIHADSGLDIGGNAENLLRTVPCHVWLGQATFTPALDVVAGETVAWSEEAEALLGRAPEFARDMARKAVLHYAAEKGHTFITSDIVEAVAEKLMPGRSGAPQEEPSSLSWSKQAEGLLSGLDGSLAANIRLRAEKAARRDGVAEVEAGHVARFLEEQPLTWAAAALARLTRVPEPMRDAAKARIEGVARAKGTDEVTLETVEEGLAEAREAMQQAMTDGGHPGGGGKCPVNHGKD